MAPEEVDTAMVAGPAEAEEAGHSITSPESPDRDAPPRTAARSSTSWVAGHIPLGPDGAHCRAVAVCSWVLIFLARLGEAPRFAPPPPSWTSSVNDTDGQFRSVSFSLLQLSPSKLRSVVEAGGW